MSEANLFHVYLLCKIQARTEDSVQVRTIIKQKKLNMSDIVVIQP